MFAICKLPAFLFVFLPCIFLHAQHTIIPAPVEHKAGQGYFILDKKVSIASTDMDAGPASRWFAEKLQKAGLALSAGYSAREIMIRLTSKADPTLGDEGYKLIIKPEGISLVANKPAGLFYGMQTLLQMISVDIVGGAVAIPACTIIDYPRFGWRGLMLDVSRHFFTVDEVKEYIDLMAVYKFNVLHWHLTDDQGWRVEIKSYPKLTEVGACRVVRYGTFGERIAPKPGEAATDCNFYTQEQIKEVVAYANSRHVTIVPEIDVPGHSLAAIAAYPELSTTKEMQMVSPGHKFSEWYGDGTFKMLVDNSLNPIDERVYEFLDKVFGELATLFPGIYLHAGGDEAYHGYWEKSTEVQAFMKKNNIKDVLGMQSYFMKRVGKIIESKGKKMIGWDEILYGGLAEGAAVMSWRGMKGGIAAAKEGHPVVMSPTTHAYIDYMQGDPLLEPNIYAKLYLKTCYEFDPLPKDVDAKLILGGQANLWTEKVPTYRHATYMTYPRSWAIAEAVWSPVVQKNWTDFMRRVDHHFERAELANINVSHAVYDPIVTTAVKGSDTLINIRCEHPDAIIHFTIDGTHPDAFSPVYTQAFAMPAGPVVLRTTTYRNGKPLGRVLVLSRGELRKRK